MGGMKTGAAALTVVFGGAFAAATLPFGTLLPTALADSPACSQTGCAFLSTNRSIDCVISVKSPAGTPDGASCFWTDGDRAHSVTLLASGVLQPCINPMAAQIDRCMTTTPAGGPALGYGETAALGPFSCLAEAQGITCMASPAGRGFTINSTGILPAAAPPPPAPPVEAPPVEAPPAQPETP